MISSNNEYFSGMDLILEKDPNFSWNKINYIDSINYLIAHDDDYNDYSILELGLRSRTKDNTYKIVIRFLYVNEINIKHIGGKYNQILGFEITDKTQDGWDKNQRFLVSDYENGIIKFTCKEIKVLSIERI